MSEDKKGGSGNMDIEGMASGYPKAPVEQTAPKAEVRSASFNKPEIKTNPVSGDVRVGLKTGQGMGSYFSRTGNGSCSMDYGAAGAGPGFGSPSTTIKYRAIRPDLVNNCLAAEVLLPKDLRNQHKLFRQIYLFDFIAGPATELWSSIPWSTFHLVGVSDPAKMRIFEEAIDKLDLPAHLPWMTTEFLMMGKLCVHLLFDQTKGYWNDMIIHNPDYIRITPVPLAGHDPLVDLMPDPTLVQFANSTDRRLRALAQGINPKLRLQLATGRAIPLDPTNTLYLPRRCSPYDSIGTSMYLRLLDLVAFERAIMTATIAVAYRRAGPLRVVQMGGETWEPTPDEMDEMARMILNAEEDPTGSVIVVRRDVDFSSQPNLGAETWKMSDEWSFLQEAKLKALGLSDTFISGEATYSTADMTLSVFLERIRTLRALFTGKFVYNKILEPLAHVHQMYKTTRAQLDHRIRVGTNTGSPAVDIPSVIWKKQLTPQGDSNYLSILETIEGKGVPITLKTWATAGALDLEAEMDQLDHDKEIREKIKNWKESITPPEEAAGGGNLFGSLENEKEESAMLKTGALNKELPITKHPFYNKMSRKFLNVSVDFINERVVSHLDGFDRKSKWEKKNTLEKIKQEVQRMSQRDKDTVMYLLKVCGLPSTSVSNVSAHYFIEQLQNRVKPDSVTYWQTLYSILGARGNNGSGPGPDFSKHVPKVSLKGIAGLKEQKLMENSLPPTNILTGVVRSSEINPAGDTHETNPSTAN